MKSLIHNVLIKRTENIFIQLLRYLMVSTAAFVVNISLAKLIPLYADMTVASAATVGFSAGLVANYLLSIQWVFAQPRHRSISRKIADFFCFSVIGIVGLGMTSFLTWLITREGEVPGDVSSVLASGVAFLWNFLGRRLFLQSLLHLSRPLDDPADLSAFPLSGSIFDTPKPRPLSLTPNISDEEEKTEADAGISPEINRTPKTADPRVAAQQTPHSTGIPQNLPTAVIPTRSFLNPK